MALPRAGRPAARGAALRPAVRQRQTVAGVRPLRRLVTEVLETRPLQRPAPVGQAEQPGVLLGVGATQLTLHQLSDPPTAAHRTRPGAHALREFAPSAADSDWELTVAGQRVQVIRPDKRKGGVLEFDTTLVGAATAALPACWGAHRAPRRRCRSCSKCWSAASPTGISPGCLLSRAWCRRWGPGYLGNRRCSTRCGRIARARETARPPAMAPSL